MRLDCYHRAWASCVHARSRLVSPSLSPWCGSYPLCDLDVCSQLRRSQLQLYRRVSHTVWTTEYTTLLVAHIVSESYRLHAIRFLFFFFCRVLFRLFGVTSENFDNLALLIVVTNLSSLLPLPLLWYLPKEVSESKDKL